MLTEDYIMRMINLALAVLVKIMGFKQAGRYQEAIQHIDQALEMLFGMRADLIRRLDDNSLLDALTVQETIDIDRLLVVAELFYEEGDILVRQDRKVEATLSRLRALNFYLEVTLSAEPDSFSELDNKITELLIDLREHDLSPETLYSLFVYYAHLGKYSAAEERLYQLAESTSSDADINLQLKEFYQNLLSKTDEEIIRGGLTRDIIISRMK
ncbi:MAG: DUF6483 family protein, partial [Anaerolineales bacterium]